MRVLKFEVQPIVRTENCRKQKMMWQKDSSSWFQPTTVHSFKCLLRRPTMCTDTLPVQTQNWIYLLLSFNRMKRKTLKTTESLQRGCCCHSPEQQRPACVKMRRANQIAKTRVILLFWKLDPLWLLHSVPFVRLCSVSLGVIFPDYDSLPHYMEGNMTHSAFLGSGPLQNHTLKMLFHVHFTEWCVGSWLELMAWHDFPSSWDLVCSSVTSPHGMSHPMGRVPKR